MVALMVVRHKHNNVAHLWSNPSIPETYHEQGQIWQLQNPMWATWCDKRCDNWRFSIMILQARDQFYSQMNHICDYMKSVSCEIFQWLESFLISNHLYVWKKQCSPIHCYPHTIMIVIWLLSAIMIEQSQPSNHFQKSLFRPWMVDPPSLDFQKKETRKDNFVWWSVLKEWLLHSLEEQSNPATCTDDRSRSPFLCDVKIQWISTL